MGYKTKSTIDIPLDDLGDNNGTPFFVRIQNPRLMTFDEKMGFAKFAKIEDEKEKIEGMKGVAKGLIVAWNLLDKETEQPVDCKAEDALNRVPSEVVEEIFKSFAPKEQSEEVKNS